jgi:ribosomal protein S18 acetylase RimI-like enzyme
MSTAVSLRPIVPDDEPLLYRIYASTRAEELKQIPWDDAQKEAFLRQQFTAQHTYYTEQFSEATFDVVLVGDEPAGRLYVDRREDEFRIVDIALLPEFRGRGIGSALLRDLFEEAAAAKKPVRIHVEPYNPARDLYERLGFRTIGQTGAHVLMEWNPDPD